MEKGIGGLLVWKARGRRLFVADGANSVETFAKQKEQGIDLIP